MDWIAGSDDGSNILLLGSGELEGRCAELLTAATPVYRPNDRKSSTGAALFGRLTDGGVELCREQPSRQQCDRAQHEHFPYCRFLLTHEFEVDDGDHVIVVGANPSVARSFQGSIRQDDEYPQSDSTAKRLFQWASDGSLDGENWRIGRLSVVNLFPVVEPKLDAANRILRSCDVSTIAQINKACLDALESVAFGQVHIVLAYGRLRNKYWCELERKFLEELTFQSLWQLNFSNRLDYPPHPLHRSAGSRFDGLKLYEIKGVSN